MRHLILVSGLALALAACGGKSDDKPRNDVVVNEPEAPPEYNVDECPRADGSACL